MRSVFAEGFVDELEKCAGLITGPLGAAGKAAGGFMGRHPFLTIFGLLPAATGAGKAFAGRMAGAAGEEGRVIAAKPFQPSGAFYTNFHQMFPHELQPWEKFRLHRNFPAYRATQGPLA